MYSTSCETVDVEFHRHESASTDTDHSQGVYFQLLNARSFLYAAVCCSLAIDTQGVFDITVDVVFHWPESSYTDTDHSQVPVVVHTCNDVPGVGTMRRATVRTGPVLGLPSSRTGLPCCCLMGHVSFLSFWRAC